MRAARYKGLIYVITLILLINLAGCTSDATPTQAVKIDELQVRTIVNNMLDGYNLADYAAFSKDLSPKLKQVMDEVSFKNFCKASMDSMGQYRSITEVKQVSSDKKSSTWLITAKFEHSTEFFHITINANGQIDGMDFGPNT